MKKETGIAIVLGIFLGVSMAIFLVVRSRTEAINKSKTIMPSVQATPAIIVTNTNSQTLEISEPQDGLIVKANSVKIIGKASKDALLVLQSPIKDMVVNNTKGDFSFDYPLAYGENVIRIVSYPKDRQLRVQERELRIYYLED